MREEEPRGEESESDEKEAERKGREDQQRMAHEEDEHGRENQWETGNQGGQTSRSCCQACRAKKAACREASNPFQRSAAARRAERSEEARP